MARRRARRHAVDLPGAAAGEHDAGRVGAHGLPADRVSTLHGLARRLGQSARHRARTAGSIVLSRARTPPPIAGAGRPRRSRTAPFHVMPLAASAARRRVRPAAARRRRARCPPELALVHDGLRPEARSDSPPAGAGRRRSQAGARAVAALQHHQRRHRSDSADRHRRPAAHRERARADALHRVRRGERRPPRRRADEQHAAVVGALEQGDRGDRRDAARAAARQSGRRIGPAVRAAQHRHRGRAAGHRRRLDSAQRHRPAPRERGDRGELPQDARRRGAGARRKRPAEPDHRLGRRPDRRDRRRRRDLADERAGRAPVHDARAAPSEIEQRWVQANDAHFSSFIAGMLVSADQRRVGEIGAERSRDRRGRCRSRRSPARSCRSTAS